MFQVNLVTGTNRFMSDWLPVVCYFTYRWIKQCSSGHCVHNVCILQQKPMDYTKSTSVFEHVLCMVDKCRKDSFTNTAWTQIQHNAQILDCRINNRLQMMVKKTLLNAQNWSRASTSCFAQVGSNIGTILSHWGTGVMPLVWWYRHASFYYNFINKMQNRWRNTLTYQCIVKYRNSSKPSRNAEVEACPTV